MIQTILTLIVLVTINEINAGGGNVPNKKLNDVLALSYYNDCEGKYAANYTFVSVGTINQAGNYQTASTVATNLIQTSSHEKTQVNSLQPLLGSNYPAGANVQADGLFLVTGGPLEGRYLYVRKVALSYEYLKKSSSILGNSYVQSTTLILLISDKLDINVLLSPTGAFEVFKKGCTTVCNGTSTVL